MIGQFLAGSLAANKIIDQGGELNKIKAANSNLQKVNRDLVRDYNSLLEYANGLKDNLKKAYNNEKTISHEDTKVVLGLIDQQHDLKEWQDEAKEVLSQNKDAAQYELARYMMFLRIAQRVPEDILMTAFAETFTDHPPEIIQREFGINHPEQLEEQMEKHIVGDVDHPEKYQEIKKKVIRELMLSEDIEFKESGGMRM